MKRSERKKSETKTEKGHPDPDNTSKDQHQRHVNGSIRVSGQIEVHNPPDSAKEETPEQKKTRTYRFANFVVSTLTLLAVVIYAGLTAWQACLTRDISRTANAQLVSSNRPWIGPDEKLPVITGPIIIDAKKTILTNYQMSAMSYGNNGANNLWFWAQLYIAQDITTIYDREKYACSQATPDKLGRVIFPHQERIMSISRPAFAMDTIPNTHADPPQKDYEVYLLACIGYRDHAGNPYHTGTIYRGVKPGTVDNLTFEIVPNSSIPVEWHDWYSFID
jgi:hypothetical protein